MNDEELARRAVTRRILSEGQLREARSFAEGGRSLAAVLFDLGYLRSEHLPDLLRAEPPPPPPRLRPLKWILATGILTFLAFSGGRCSARIPGENAGAMYNQQLRNDIAWQEGEIQRLRFDLANQKTALSEHLRARGLEILAEAEARLKKEGSLSMENRKRFQEGATILALAAERGKLNADNWMTLGRAREVLLEWEPALEAYRRMESDPRALLGAARAALELGMNVDATFYARRSNVLKPSGEAFLIFGQAELRLGRKDEARRAFIKARQLDPSLGPAAANLLDRIEKE